MSLIGKKINESASEKIRDKTCEVLALELAYQADGKASIPASPDDFAGDQDLKILDQENQPNTKNIVVWCERATPFDKTELPTVNISIEDIVWDDEIQGCSNGTTRINIDCYYESPSEYPILGGIVQEGDYLSRTKLHKLIRYIKGILNHEAYDRLGFNSNVVLGGTFLKNAEINDVLSANSENITASRLSFEVKFTEKYNYRDLMPIAGVDSLLKNTDPSKGIYYTLNF